MRPVDKGTSPRTYSHHSQARPDLLERIGHYCSYCEMPIQNAPEVEHAIPVHRGGQAKDWSNFLLACRYCNGIKQAKNLSRKGYFWPDLHNTFRAFKYEEGHPIIPNPSLTHVQCLRVERLISLCGLDREMGAPNQPTDRDTRWLFRDQAWGRAKRALDRWKRVKGTPHQRDMAESIVGESTATGFFSIWMEVFGDEKDIRQMLIDHFIGTAKNCFDPNAQPIVRPTSFF